MVTNIMSIFNRAVASMVPDVPQVMKLVPPKVSSLSTVMLSLHGTTPRELLQLAQSGRFSDREVRLGPSHQVTGKKIPR